jgi:hypothetical protein
MGDIGIQITVVLGLLLLAVLWSARRAGAREGVGTLFGRWLALTVLVLWIDSMIAFIGVHAMLFLWGTGAAAVGFAISAAFFIATPFACAMIVRRRRHDHGPLAHQG